MQCQEDRIYGCRSLHLKKRIIQVTGKNNQQTPKPKQAKKQQPPSQNPRSGIHKEHRDKIELRNNQAMRLSIKR